MFVIFGVAVLLAREGVQIEHDAFFPTIPHQEGCLELLSQWIALCGSTFKTRAPLSARTIPGMEFAIPGMVPVP